jgi:hypothetical protein
MYHKSKMYTKITLENIQNMEDARHRPHDAMSYIKEVVHIF